MALTSGPEILPNLKIQVENELLDEAMEVDEDRNERKKDEASGNVDSELEEGEISDSKDDDDPPTSHAFKSSLRDLPELPDFERRYENKSGAFVTGIDIFSKDGQEKLNVRAKRFGLDPSEAKPLTSVQLHELYESLGITETEESALEKQGYRLDSLHIRGTDDMSTQDVFDYFKEFGPASIEWINDVSCNVVWLDKASPARALLGVSRPISGLMQTSKRDMEEVVLVHEEEGDSEEEDMADTSINTQQPSVDESLNASTQEDKAASKVKDNGAVPASEINVPIPPGYWRLGTSCPKAKFILLRYSTRNDRKPKQAEKMSEYYKKYGNPNYGGIRGIISTSRKRRYHSDRRHSEPDIDADFGGGKNPWGSLAQNWGTMDRSHTKPGFFDPDDPLLLDKPTELRNILRTGRSNPPPPPPTIHSSESDSEISSESSEEDSKWRKRLKVPLMRMYADDEEKKIEKRKKLKAKYGTRRSPILTQSTDLRSKLAQSARPKLTRGSVWTRLEAARTTREVQLAEPSEDEWSSEPEEDVDDVVITTVRSQVNDLRHTLGNRKNRDDGDDLRSKLNRKKSKKDTISRSPQPTSSYNKSPLRIEINNDEYCGESGSESGSGSSSGSSTGSGSSSSSSSSGSSSGSSSSGSESSDEEAEKHKSKSS